MRNSRPRILAILPIFCPSTVISVVKPLIHLHRAGYVTAKITLESLVSQYDIEKADLIILCRNTEPRYAWWLDYVLHKNIPFIYDLDDNFFEIPLDSEMGRYHRAPERIAMLTRYISQANLVRVYSAPLFEKVKTLNTRVEMVVGPVDLDLISPLSTKPNDGMIRLVYATSRRQDELADIFMPALRRLLSEYVGRIEMHFWGCDQPGLHTYPNVHFHPMILDYDRFLRKFSQAGFDIGLAPLWDSVFYRSKTNNKFREYGACRIAGIYSDVDVYSMCVVHGETGLLVPNQPEEWYKAMVRLVEDRHLCERIKNQAQEYVRKHYSHENFEQVWWAQIQRILTDHRDGTAISPLLSGRGLTMSPAPGNRSQNGLLLGRFIRQGFQSIWRVLSKDPESRSYALRQYWNTLKMLLRCKCL